MATGARDEESLRETAPCHKAIHFPELPLASGKLIVLLIVIQKPGFLESLVCLCLPIFIPQNFLENMETKHTWALGLATTLPIPWHVTRWPWGFEEAMSTHCVAGCASCGLFMCSFKSQQLQ